MAPTEREKQIAWFLDDLRVIRGASPHTVQNYSRDLARYLQDVDRHGIGSWADVLPRDVERYAQALAAGTADGAPLAPASVSRHLSAIRSFHKWLVKQNLAQSNPASGVAAPKTPQLLPKALPFHTIEALLEAARQGPPVQAVRDSALVELLYGTGARISEVLHLAADDLHLEGEFPIVRLTGKGNKERIVPLGSYAVRSLEQYLSRSRPALAAKGKGTTLLFLNLRGNPLSRQSAWEIIQTCAKRAGIESSISPHTLRHSFATHLLDGGASIREVQELLGHASVTTTQIYTRLTPQALQEVFLQSHPRAL